MKILPLILSLIFFTACAAKNDVKEISVKKVETYAMCGSIQPVEAETLDSTNSDLRNIEILITNLQKYKNFEIQALKIIECYEKQTNKK